MLLPGMLFQYPSKIRLGRNSIKYFWSKILALFVVSNLSVFVNTFHSSDLLPKFLCAIDKGVSAILFATVITSIPW
jgi:hypothetical protein